MELEYVGLEIELSMTTSALIMKLYGQLSKMILKHSLAH